MRLAPGWHLGTGMAITILLVYLEGLEVCMNTDILVSETVLALVNLFAPCFSLLHSLSVSSLLS